MSTAEILLWIAVAIIQWGILSSLYKENPFYDLVEGLGMGATAATVILDNWATVNTQIYLPLVNQWATQWWVVLSIVLGLMYFTMFARRLVEIFRVVAMYALAIEIGLAVRTYVSTAFTQVTQMSVITDIGTLVAWIMFWGGILYYIWSAKIARTRVGGALYSIGRWIMIIEVGTLFAPMFFRYVEIGARWTVQINESPGWWVPFVVFAGIAVDALNQKYKFIGGHKEVAQPAK